MLPLNTLKTIKITYKYYEIEDQEAEYEPRIKLVMENSKDE